MNPLSKADFRRLLNALPQKQLWRNGRYRQLKRPYGDYLYAQDREMFENDYKDYVEGRLTL